MSEQVMIGRELLERIAELLSWKGGISRHADDVHAAYVELGAALSVSAQPAGEVPEVVGYGFQHVDKGWLFSTKSYHEVNPCLEGVGLMTVAQHTRIVAALQARAVVLPERSNERGSDGELTYEAVAHNRCLDQVARINGIEAKP